MTALPCDTATRLPAAERWDRIRSAVFWLAIAVILIMPGILSAFVLLRLQAAG